MYYNALQLKEYDHVAYVQCIIMSYRERMWWCWVCLVHDNVLQLKLYDSVDISVCIVMR